MPRKILLTLVFVFLAVAALTAAALADEAGSGPDVETASPAAESAPEPAVEPLAQGGRCLPCDRLCLSSGGTCVQRSNGKFCCEGASFLPLPSSTDGESSAFLGLPGRADCGAP